MRNQILNIVLTSLVGFSFGFIVGLLRGVFLGKKMQLSTMQKDLDNIKNLQVQCMDLRDQTVRIFREAEEILDRAKKQH